MAQWKPRRLCSGSCSPSARVRGSIRAGRCKRNSTSIPGKKRQSFYVLGQADDAEHARRLIAQYRDTENVERSLEETRAWWDDLLNTIQVKTPVLSVNFMLNRWLLYQSLSCRIWGRSAHVSIERRVRFRDQLQDSLALRLLGGADSARVDLACRVAAVSKETCSTGGIFHRERVFAPGARTICCGFRSRCVSTWMSPATRAFSMRPPVSRGSAPNRPRSTNSIFSRRFRSTMRPCSSTAAALSRRAPPPGRMACP
jgi:hypothetical protein